MLLGFVFVVMGISFLQQRRSERSLEALRDLSSPRARGYARRAAPAHRGRDLVWATSCCWPRATGCRPTCGFTEPSNFAVDESLLTGESAPVIKQAATPLCSAGDVASPGPAAIRSWRSRARWSRGARRAGACWPPASAARWAASAQSLAGIVVESTPIQQETRAVVKRVRRRRPGAGRGPGGGLRGCARRLAARAAGRADAGDGHPAGRTAGGADAVPRSGCLAAGARKGAGPQHPGGRVAGRHDRAVRRQDRHADGQPHGGATPVVRGGAWHAVRLRRRPAPLQEELHGVLEYAVLASHRRAFDPMERPSARPDSACWPTPSTCMPTGPWSTTTRCRRRCWRCRGSGSRRTGASG